MMEQLKTLKWAFEILKREANAGLYGTVAFKFERGKITCVKTEKTEKPTDVD